jgi:LysR family transcriptional activator of nhaA
MDKTWMNYHHLYLFMTIATESGVARAAKKLRLGQSTLSTQLSQFESHLGVQLFERKQKRLHLTEAGKITLAYAREIFHLGAELLDALQDRRHVHRLRVQVGVEDALQKHVVLKLIAMAQESQPCALSVVEGLAADLLRAPHYAYLQQGFPQSLEGQPFSMPGAYSHLRHDVEHFLKLQGVSIDVLLEAQDASLQVLFAKQGAGLTPVAAPIGEELMTEYPLIKIGTLDTVYEELWLIGSQRRLENPVAAHLLRHFRL